MPSSCSFFSHKKSLLTLGQINVFFEAFFCLTDSELKASHAVAKSDKEPLGKHLIIRLMGMDAIYGIEFDYHAESGTVPTVVYKKALFALMKTKNQQDRLELLKKHCDTFLKRRLSQFNNKTLKHHAPLIQHISDNFNATTLSSLTEGFKEREEYELYDDFIQRYFILGQNINTLAEIADGLELLFSHKVSDNESALRGIASMVNEFQKPTDIESRLVEAILEKIGMSEEAAVGMSSLKRH